MSVIPLGTVLAILRGERFPNTWGESIHIGYSLSASKLELSESPLVSCKEDRAITTLADLFGIEDLVGQAISQGACNRCLAERGSVSNQDRLRHLLLQERSSVVQVLVLATSLDLAAINRSSFSLAHLLESAGASKFIVGGRLSSFSSDHQMPLDGPREESLGDAALVGEISLVLKSFSSSSDLEQISIEVERLGADGWGNLSVFGVNTDTREAILLGGLATEALCLECERLNTVKVQEGNVPAIDSSILPWRFESPTRIKRLLMKQQSAPQSLASLRQICSTLTAWGLGNLSFRTPVKSLAGGELLRLRAALLEVFSSFHGGRWSYGKKRALISCNGLGARERAELTALISHRLFGDKISEEFVSKVEGDNTGTEVAIVDKRQQLPGRPLHLLSTKEIDGPNSGLFRLGLPLIEAGACTFIVGDSGVGKTLFLSEYLPKLMRRRPLNELFAHHVWWPAAATAEVAGSSTTLGELTGFEAWLEQYYLSLPEGRMRGAQWIQGTRLDPQMMIFGMTITELRERTVAEVNEIFEGVAQIQAWHGLLQSSLPHLVGEYKIGESLRDITPIERQICSLAALLICSGTGIERTIFLLDDPVGVAMRASSAETTSTCAEDVRIALTIALGRLLSDILHLGGSVVVATRFVPDEIQTQRGEKTRFSFPHRYVYLKIEEHEPTRQELVRCRRNTRVLAGLFRSVLASSAID